MGSPRRNGLFFWLRFSTFLTSLRVESTVSIFSTCAQSTVSRGIPHGRICASMPSHDRIVRLPALFGPGWIAAPGMPTELVRLPWAAQPAERGEPSPSADVGRASPFLRHAPDRTAPSAGTPGRDSHGIEVQWRHREPRGVPMPACGAGLCVARHRAAPWGLSSSASGCRAC